MAVNKELMAAYGEACIQLDIANGRHQELKRKIAEVLNQKPEPKVEETKG